MRIEIEMQPPPGMADRMNPGLGVGGNLSKVSYLT